MEIFRKVRRIAVRVGLVGLHFKGYWLVALTIKVAFLTFKFSDYLFNFHKTG
jgi:hypothetical protein